MASNLSVCIITMYVFVCVWWWCVCMCKQTRVHVRKALDEYSYTIMYIHRVLHCILCVYTSVDSLSSLLRAQRLRSGTDGGNGDDDSTVPPLKDPSAAEPMPLGTIIEEVI